MNRTVRVGLLSSEPIRPACGGIGVRYIELARRYHTVMLSGVPRFTAGDADKLRRFVWLIDEFYDRRVKLMISAAVPAPELVDATVSRDRFQAGLTASLRERLVSRLTEMQTRRYLGEPHLP